MPYPEVKLKLISDLVSGEVPPGGALANETELEKRFSVSIGTVRRSVYELIADHVLISQQGTFSEKPMELRVSVVDTRDADYVTRLVGQS